MDKPFKSIDEQIAILESRGLECDNDTRLVLEREGYYPVVNGYKDLFLGQWEDSGQEVFVKGTKFSDIYRLFGSAQRCGVRGGACPASAFS